MITMPKERGCATVAVVIAIASAAVLFGCVAYGGYKGLELNKTVTRNDAVLTEVKSYMSHLSAQLQQLQRVDTSLGARLLAVESALRGAAPGATGADEGNKKRGKGVSGKGKGKAKPKGDEEEDASTKASQSPGADPAAAAAAATTAESTSEGGNAELAKGKGKGRKGKRGGKGKRKGNRGGAKPKEDVKEGAEVEA